MRFIFKIIVPLLVISHLSLVIFSLPVCAEEGETLTKEDAIKMLSASDFVKKKVAELLSWTAGYDLSKINRAGLTPSIKSVTAIPKKIPPDGRTILELAASVDDPGGRKNIAGVRADLSPIGRLPNTMLVDTGEYGDRKAKDGVYTLQTTVSRETDVGPKEIPVSAANKSGWVAYAKTSLDVLLKPTIRHAWFDPEEAPADSKSIVTLKVEVDNPGRIEDLVKAIVDLRPLGYEEVALLRNDGWAGDEVARDNVFTLQFVIPEYIKAGKHKIRIEVQNLIGGYAAHDAVLTSYK